MRCSWRQGMLWSRRGLTVVGDPQAIGGGRWKEPSNPITTTMSTPSGTKSRTSMPTTTSHRPSSPLPLPRSVSSAASPSGRSQDSSRQSVESGTPTLQPSRKCGSATSALPGWRRSLPRSPQDHNGSKGGGNGHLAASRNRKDRPGPQWGHIRATNDQIAADNTGHQRSSIIPAHPPEPAIRGRSPPPLGAL